jgi:Ca-activated chloride channel family protein
MRATMLTLTALIALGAAAIATQNDAAAQKDDARFSARSELVLLDVAVTDERGGFVSGLPAESFRVLEEGRPQNIAFFAEQDAPATIALLIDSSGSMLVNRDRMIAGITSLAEASNPEDEFLPLVFNERVTPVLDTGTEFTSDPLQLREALANSLTVLGKTAFYDALSEAIDGVERGSHPRRVVIVLSDGGDNASRITSDELLQKVEASNVVIYTMALIDPIVPGHNAGALRHLAKVTGGLAFEPKTKAHIGKAFHTIAADIRSRYTLAYEPEDTSSGKVKGVRVLVAAPEHKDLKVRTRTAYVAGSYDASPSTALRSGAFDSPNGLARRR